ncbi:arylsulfatase [Planctomycetota bacterium]|nr:arylsulfatase [Planctomycetota bacterium]
MQWTKTISKPLLCGAYACTSLAGNQCYAESKVESPNIIFILADDMGYGDISALGQTNFTTPNLDQMIKDGMSFTQAYTGSTVSAPSRACLLTGQHTGHVFQRHNAQIQFRPDPMDITIATLLQGADYKTAMIGKSGLSCASSDGDLPNQKGFDHFYGFVHHGNAHRQYPQKLWRNGEQVTLEGNYGKTGKQYTGNLFVNDSLEWIEQNKDNRFFLHLSLTLPHADHTVPEEYRSEFIGKFKETPYPEGRHYIEQQYPKATYAGMIKFIDSSVGRIEQKLKQLGIEENTLVIFASDNGALQGEGGYHYKDLNSSGILRGGKRDLYEGGIRTPFIVKWPGVVKSGSTSEHITAFWDFLPTACELANIGIPDWTDGISIVPTLLNQEKQQKQHQYLYWEFHEQGGKQAIRYGRWKGVRLNVKKDRYSKIELYDLVKDPKEENDISDQNSDVVVQISKLLEEAHEPSERFQLFSK